MLNNKATNAKLESANYLATQTKQCNKKLRISLLQLLWFYYSIFLEGDNKEEEL